MFKFEAKEWVPKFIMRDKNGYAVAKAIEAGVQIMNDTLLQGVKYVTDYEEMPEWRLDEMAWEYNIPYDYKADVETKRKWIKNTYALSRLTGTPAGVAQFMAQMFSAASIIEWPEYNGDPYHFKIQLPGDWPQEDLDWATAALDKVKNVRSVLDGYELADAYTDETGDLLVDEAGPLIVES